MSPEWLQPFIQPLFVCYETERENGSLVPLSSLILLDLQIY
jgi:hypothetical protein